MKSSGACALFCDALVGVTTITSDEYPLWKQGDCGGRVVAQLQGYLKETDYLDPFQFGFQSAHDTETALVTHIFWELDRRSATLFVLDSLDF